MALPDGVVVQTLKSDESDVKGRLAFHMTREGKTPILSTAQFKTCRRGCFAGCSFGKKSREICAGRPWWAEREARDVRGGVTVGCADSGKAEWGRS